MNINKQKSFPEKNNRKQSKFFRIMKLSVVFLMIATMQSMATGYAQNVSLNLNMNKTSIREVFREIEQQTELSFIFSDDVSSLNNEVTVNVHNRNIKDVLAQLFKDTDLDYQILNEKLIIVAPKVMLQGITITGTVIDNTGALPGVNVVVKGTNTGTVSDVNGKYQITVPNNDAVLMFSFIGFTSQEITVGNRQIIDVSMQEDAMALDEVVITALGMTREMKALGYAMTEIKGDEIARSNVTNPIQGLQGRVAGVQINLGASGPQSSQRILIRGNTSLTGNDQPIFVVDGIIIDNEVTSGGWADRDFGNAMKNLNADDFESVSILKGAAATALYGSRASNGVILITTKKGKKSEGVGIQFSHTQQWEKVYRYPDYQNEFGMGTSPVWAQVGGVDNRTVGVTAYNWGPAFDGLPYTVTNPYGSRGGKDYEGTYKAYDDNAKYFFQTGRYINTNLAVSGGSEKSTFRFSYSNLSHTGQSLNNKFTRNNFQLNATHDISRILSVSAGFTYTQSEGLNPTYQGDRFSPLYELSYSVPRQYDAEYWSKNYLDNTGFLHNPNDPWGLTSRFFVYYQNNQMQKENHYRGFVNTIFKFTDWLKLTLGADMNRVYTNREFKELAEPTTTVGTLGGGRYRINESQRLQYKGSALLTASQKYDDFSISASIGTERFHEDNSYHNSWTEGGLMVPGMFTLSNSAQNARTEGFDRWRQRRINSVYGFINADWRGQIYLDITGRNDWSSTMMYSNGEGNVSYFYPSVSSSWLIHETFKGELPSIISFAKLRASYAIVGNSTAPYTITDPGSYKFLSTYNDTKWGTGTHPFWGYTNQTLGAKNLQPEKQHSIEFGLDFRMFQNRLGFDFAYYKTNTRNQILTLSVPSETGVTSRLINAGNIQNQGIELLINGVFVRNSDWLWDASFTYTRNRNKIVELYPGMTMVRLRDGSDVSAWAEEGKPYGKITSQYAYKRNEAGDKLLQASGAYIRSNPDNLEIGNMLPKFLGGFLTNVHWKSLSFHAVLDARFGGQIWSGSYNYGMERGVLKGSLKGRTKEYGGLERTLADGRVVFDGVLPEGVFQPNTTIGGVNVSGMTYTEAYNAGHVVPLSSYFYHANLFQWGGSAIREASICDISWVAVRELSLQWSVPRAWTEKFYVKGASVGFAVRNVGYLYNSLPDGIHPEGLRSNHSAEFSESGGQAYSRNYSFKINFNF